MTAVTDANVAVVRDFLAALADSDSARATALLAPDIEWLNTGLPTFRGKRAHDLVRELERRRGLGFDVTVHSIAGNGDTVLTDRTDYLRFGPVATRFWVCGTFTVRDGLITRWHDHFSLAGFLTGFVKR